MPADLADRTDFENAERGLIARLEPGVVKNADGQVIWDIDAFGLAMRGDCPDTVNPSLWRQSQLTATQGLFEVTGGVYQVRGADLSNMTMVESDHGVIVIDPLVSQECAAASLALYRRHRGDRAVTAVIYTHSHIDHFGGVLGVVDAGTSVPIIAPEHFMEHSVSENVYAGTAMLRRGFYYSGGPLRVGPEGKVGMGLGAAASTGTIGLIAPTLDITRTGQEEVVDGVRIRFLLTGRIPLNEAVGYWIAQFAGGIAGALALWGTFSTSPFYHRTITGLGTDGYGRQSMIRIGVAGAFIFEVVLTAIFVFIVLRVTSATANAATAAIAIGLTLTVVHLVGIPVTGTSVNPARSLGPALVVGGTALSQVWLFIVAPLIGGVLAAGLHRLLYREEDIRLAAEAQQASR